MTVFELSENRNKLTEKKNIKDENQIFGLPQLLFITHVFVGRRKKRESFLPIWSDCEMSCSATCNLGNAKNH